MYFALRSGSRSTPLHAHPERAPSAAQENCRYVSLMRRQLDEGSPTARVENDTSHVRLPRLTRQVFRDLAIWMVGLGLCTGLVFPPFVLLLGLPADRVLTGTFFAATLGAGLFVGALNYRLARTVVGGRLALLTGHMAEIEETLRRVVERGDASDCDPELCRMPVDSDDELGSVAEAFNALVEALATSHRVNDVHRAMGAVLSSHLDLDVLCVGVLRELRSRLDLEGVALCLERDGELVVAAADGLGDSGAVAASDPVRLAQRDGCVVRLDLPEDVVLDAGIVTFRPRSVLAVPLQLRRVGIGVLLVASTDVIEDEVERLLERLAPHLAIALHNALGHERLRRIAARDALTDLYNRRYGMERLAEEFYRAVRTGEPLGLLLFDLDHFKQINDVHGHLVGDRVLVAVAKRARRALREGDVLFRFGGEEFLAILPGAGHEDVVSVGERMGSIVAEAPAVPGIPTVTISLGGVSFPATDAADVDDLVRAADHALYLAKAAGRNRVVVADSALRAAS